MSVAQVVRINDFFGSQTQGGAGPGIPYRYPVSKSSRRRQKKNGGLHNRSRTTKLSILEHIVVYTDIVGSGLAPSGTIKHQKTGEITYLGKFFSCIIRQSQYAAMFGAPSFHKKNIGLALVKNLQQFKLVHLGWLSNANLNKLAKRLGLRVNV